ncbi:MAG: dTMP kinase [Alphaproteobacteria bacterium]|nr:dTMP kinase [Alphaproteobacteria bacterium]
MRRGRFITLEGGEGAGKSTQAKRLKEYLESQGIQPVLTREPGGTEGAESIRTLLLHAPGDAWDEVTETLLFFAARRDHVIRKIQPALAQGSWVISDRFADSTLCYQGFAGKLGPAYVEMLYRLTLGVFAPDMTFILDLPVSHGMERMKTRGQATDRFEGRTQEFHEGVRRGFLELASRFPERCHVIDASKDEHAVHAQIRSFFEAA